MIAKADDHHEQNDEDDETDGGDAAVTTLGEDLLVDLGVIIHLVVRFVGHSSMFSISQLTMMMNTFRLEYIDSANETHKVWTLHSVYVYSPG